MSNIHVISKEFSKDEALATIDDLRSKVEAGEVVGFCAVGIGPDDSTRVWQASVGRITQLRLFGAVSFLAHCTMSGD